MLSILILKHSTTIFTGSLPERSSGPVKKSLVKIAKSGRHLEITTLIIPGHNDSEKRLPVRQNGLPVSWERIPSSPESLFPYVQKRGSPTRDETLERL